MYLSKVSREWLYALFIYALGAVSMFMATEVKADAQMLPTGECVFTYPAPVAVDETQKDIIFHRSHLPCQSTSHNYVMSWPAVQGVKSYSVHVGYTPFAMAVAKRVKEPKAELIMYEMPLYISVTPAGGEVKHILEVK